MTLIEVLKQDAESMYAVTEALFRRVDPATLAWKPAVGQNWMTMGQLVMHCTNACGAPMKGFLTGDWGLPEGMKFEDIKPEDMLPPAEKLPAVDTMEQAFKLLAEDRATAAAQLSTADESRLLAESFPPPWGGRPVLLFQHLNNMIGHLGNHKSQLFYYLKLMGQDVNTMDMYGA